MKVTSEDNGSGNGEDEEVLAVVTKATVRRRWRRQEGGDIAVT